MIDIPFNRFCKTGAELRYIQQAMDQLHISGDGPFTKKCQALLEQLIGSAKALLTTSCTHALEMAALLLDIKPNDEVIVPSFTFVSTANAFALRGARISFADIRPDTLNLDESQLPALITDRTRAIVAVHYAGVACEMDAISKFPIPLVEDNAHGLFGSYRGKPLGSLGCLATQSFHETKNVTCGEGGALLINDPALAQRAEYIREKGTNRSRFFRGQVDKYNWVDLGSSYLPSEILAAMLYAQLEARHAIQRRRARLWHQYYGLLRDWAAEEGVRLPYGPQHCSQAFHLFYLLLHDLHERQRFIEHMRQAGVHTVFHYVPLHSSPMGRQFGGQCPVTEDISNRLVRLPFYCDLSDAEVTRVVNAVRSFRANARSTLSLANLNQQVVAVGGLPVTNKV